MSGNVWEWVLDYYDDYDSLSVVDPDRSRVKEIYRVLRGGSFVDSNDSVRCAHRNWSYPDNHDNSVGFRLVALPPSE